MDASARESSSELSEAMHARLRDELAEGERVVWSSRPRPWAMGAGCGVVAAVLFCGVPLVGGLVLLLWSFEARRADERFAFGLGLCTAGLLLALLMTWVNRAARRAREATFYVLTDRRAITWTAILGGQVTVRSFHPPDLRGLHRTENADGSGNLILQEHSVPGHKGMPTIQPLGFLGIDRVREVEQLIRDTLLRTEAE